MPNRDYDTTVARMAGNIAAGFVSRPFTERPPEDKLVEFSVKLARELITEVRKTEPTTVSPPSPLSR